MRAAAKRSQVNGEAGGGPAACGACGEPEERLTAKALRRMQYRTNIRVRNIGTGKGFPQSTTDGMIWWTRTGRRFVTHGGGPAPRPTLTDRQLGRGASESSRRC